MVNAKIEAPGDLAPKPRKNGRGKRPGLVGPVAHIAHGETDLLSHLPPHRLLERLPYLGIACH